jgi:hypothetical protein
MAGRGLQVASVTVSRGDESDGDVSACANAQAVFRDRQ